MNRLTRISGEGVQVREDDFREWLAQGGTTPKAGLSRAYAVRTIEKNLSQLGSSDTDLDAAWQADRFDDLKQRLKDVQNDFTSGGERFRILMPHSTNPVKRLQVWLLALGRYGQFLDGEARQSSLSDADQQTLLNRLTKTEIEAAMAECDAEGISTFLTDHSFGHPRRWIVREESDARYPAKAVVAAAISFLPDGPDLTSRSFFKGFGERQAFACLERLGFNVTVPESSEPGILDRFRKNPDFDKAASSWSEAQRQAFICLAQDVHDVGLDWWFNGVDDELARFGRKERGKVSARAVVGFLRANGQHVDIAKRNDALGLSLGRSFALEEQAVNDFNARLSRNIETIKHRLSAKLSRPGYWPDELDRDTATSARDSTSIWIVTARHGAEDGLQRFIERGEWCLLNDTDSPSNRRIVDMQPGDRIVMRDYFHQTQDLPFDGQGNRISAIRIRAMGTVTERHNDGLSVGVNWNEPLSPLRVWYFYTQPDPVWQLKPPGQSDLADRLRAFLMDGAEQDYAFFLKRWFAAGSLSHLESQTTMPSPTNLILYGPPGTGKTYSTALEAVRLCGEEPPEDRDELMELYASLHHKGRIGFVTFHQNFSYEDFIEGLRPHTAPGDSGFTLAPEPGIFRRMAELAGQPVITGNKAFSFEGRRIFKLSLGQAGKKEWDWVYDSSIEDGQALIGFCDIDWSDARFADRDAILQEAQARFPDEKISAQSGLVKSTDRFRNQMSVGDVIIVSKGLSAFRAIGVVEGGYEYAPNQTGDYCHRRKLTWLWQEPDGVPLAEITDTRFSLDTTYELPRARLNMDVLQRYIDSARAAEEGDGQILPHVLIIDEINRANISKVFGELITLLEPDKRLGMRNALTVRLPYSKTDFGVPANLHLIGTMNTADRSIALLDTALRRRFTFREMAPRPDLLETVDGVPLADVLTAINERIEYIVDREHRIGHAFFIDCADRTDIDAVMRDKVIPLLQEYFFEDWSRIAAVLGPGFIEGRKLKAPPGLGDLGERETWAVRQPFAPDAYNRLVAGDEASTQATPGA